MEEYEDFEGDAFDAPDAPDATTNAGGQENGQNRQMIRQPEFGFEGKLGGNSGVLKATSGNGAKRRATIRAGKTAEATVKQLATKELQIEKARMEGWKQMVMTEVALELQGMKRAHVEAMGIQSQGFQLELEKVKEMLDLVESRSAVLEEELRLLKNRKPALEKELAQSVHASTGRNKSANDKLFAGSDYCTSPSTPAVENIVMTPSSSQVNKGVKATKPVSKSYAQIAASNAAKSESSKSWKNVVSRKRKGNTINPPKIEPEKRRLIFRRRTNLYRKSEADIILALNESLQRAGISAYMRFSKVSYSQSGAISALLAEKSNAEDLIQHHSNTLIRAAKSIDKEVIGIETLERWHRLKVHGMPLLRYFGEGRMELLCREIELSSGIKLKTTPRWLISEARLEERLKSGTGRGSAIVITVGNDTDISKLCAKGLRFGGAPKVVERYWESGPSSVCMTCSGIGHDRLGGCNDRPEKYVICTGPHKLENHRCGVTGCSAKNGKSCIHIVPKCANCEGNHQATAFKCPAWLKAQSEDWKEKSKKLQPKDKQAPGPNIPSLGSERGTDNSKGKPAQEPEENLDLVMENNNWAAGPVVIF